MRVVIIGGSGHVGTYLVPRLVEAGHEVVNRHPRPAAALSTARGLEERRAGGRRPCADGGSRRLWPARAPTCAPTWSST